MDQSAALASEADIAGWYDGKDFSCDWTTNRIPLWLDVLEDYRDRPVRVLEIGSWEGRSALFFLNYLRQCHLVCVDTFGGNIEHHQDDYFAALLPGIEARFDSNGRFAESSGWVSASIDCRRSRTCCCHVEMSPAGMGANSWAVKPIKVAITVL